MKLPVYALCAVIAAPVAFGAATRTPEPQVPAEPAGSQPPGAYPNFSVTAANWVMITPPGVDYSSAQFIMNLEGNGPIPWCVSRYNRGDIAVRLNPRDPQAARGNLGILQEFANAPATEAPGQAWRLSPDAGVVLPSVRKNGQMWEDGAGAFWGTVAIGNSSSGNGYSLDDGSYGTGNYELQTGRAGGRTEANINFATAWFPYDLGWLAGFVGDPGAAGEANWRTPNSHSGGLADAAVVTWAPRDTGFGGLAKLALPGVHAINDGLLFVVSAKGDSNVKIAAAAPVEDGSGWIVTIREDAAVDPTVLVGAGSDFAFVHVPFTAAGLIGGYINGEDAAKIKSAGEFAVTRLAAGRYELSVPGKGGDDGMLILCNADLLAGNPDLADNNFLSYEFNAATGKFIIEARHTTGDEQTALEDTDFVFAWVDFASPLQWRPILHAGPVPQVPDAPEGSAGPGPFPNTSVTAANWNAFTPAGLVYDDTKLSIGITEQGPISWAISRYNRGDLALRLSPRDPVAALTNQNLTLDYARAEANQAPGQSWRTSPDVGVILPAVRRLGAEYPDGAGPFYGTIAIGNSSSGTGYSMDDGSFGTGNFELQTGRAGGRTEANINFASSWFPYDQGWTAGFVGDVTADGAAAWRTGGSHSQDLGVPSVVTWIGANGSPGGLAELSLTRIHAINDGILFTISAKGDSNVKISSAPPKTDGSGWTIALREDAEIDPNVLVTAGSDFAFLFVPYDAANLIGGYINGDTGAKIKSAGTFTVARVSVGRYEVTIPGKTGADGMLILGNADFLAGASGLPDNNFLAYEYNAASGKFFIEARHTTGAENTVPEDTHFVLAWVDFKQPLARFAAAATTAPALAVRRSGTNVVLSWPAGTGYRLQSAARLAAGAFADVAGAPAVVGDKNELTLPAASSAMFFRLAK